MKINDLLSVKTCSVAKHLAAFNYLSIAMTEFCLKGTKILLMLSQKFPIASLKNTLEFQCKVLDSLSCFPSYRVSNKSPLHKHHHYPRYGVSRKYTLFVRVATIYTLDG